MGLIRTLLGKLGRRPIWRSELERLGIEVIDNFEKFGPLGTQMFVAKGVFDSLAGGCNELFSESFSRSPMLVFENDLSMNAFSWESPDKTPIIGIKVGTVFYLTAVMGRLFCHPDVFPELGDPGVYTNRRPLFINEIQEGKVRFLPSNHRKRRAAAINCLHYALSFIAFHELGHIYHGHTSKYGASEPRFEIGLPADDNAMSHEINADMFAAYSLVGPERAAKEPQAAMAAGMFFPTNPIVSWAFSVGILFRTLAVLDPEKNLYVPEGSEHSDAIDTALGLNAFDSHPHPLWREKIAKIALLKRGNAPMKYLDEGFVLAEKAWTTVGWPTSEKTEEVTKQFEALVSKL